jgi:hypothetical protein
MRSSQKNFVGCDSDTGQGREEGFQSKVKISLNCTDQREASIRMETNDSFQSLKNEYKSIKKNLKKIMKKVTKINKKSPKKIMKKCKGKINKK